MRVAFVQAQVACMLAELEGMKAANREAAASGRSPDYHPSDFFALPDRYTVGHNAVIAFLVAGDR